MDGDKRVRPRHWVMLTLVLVNVLLFFFLIGAFSYSEMQAKVVDEDTQRACLNQLGTDNGGYGMQYQLTDVRYGGPRVLEAEFTWEARSDLDDPPEQESGTLRCTVATYDDESSIQDPLLVVDLEVAR